MALVVYTDTADLEPSVGVAILEAAGHRVVRLETHDPVAISAAAAEAEALLVSYAPIDAELLDRLPRLELISLMTVGTDQVDLAAAQRRGVAVANVGGVSTDDVASHALTLALATIRALPQFLRLAADETWFDAPDPVVPPRVTELTLGLVGMGRIGRRLALMAAGIFGKVQYFDPGLPPDVEVGGVGGVSWDELLSSSDVICVQVAASHATSGLFGAEAFSRMKSGSYLVNVSRGSVVDSASLVAALDSGRLAGAGLDVLDVEPPPPDHPLLRHARVLVTPHVAYLSRTSQVAYATEQARNVLDWFAGAELVNSVNGIRHRS